MVIFSKIKMIGVSALKKVVIVIIGIFLMIVGFALLFDGAFSIGYGR